MIGNLIGSLIPSNPNPSVSVLQLENGDFLLTETGDLFIINPGPPTSFLQLESGDFLLTETNDFFIIGA